MGNNNASTTFRDVLSGGGSLTKIGSGTLTLTNANLYSGATTVSTGTLDVTGSLANNGSSEVFVAANGSAFGGTILRNVGAGAGYAGFGSAATGGNTLGLTADLIDGTNNGQAQSVSMQWRERTAAEIAAGLASDVFNLSGMIKSGSQTDQFTLRMSYSPGQLPAGDMVELFSLSGSVWENAVLGNIGGTAQFMGVNSPDGILGHYGIDPGTGDTVWAVLDYNSQFAVGAVGVPEPSTIVVLAVGLLGVFLGAWRKPR